MMRYERVSPDYLPLTNTKKPYIRPSQSRSNENVRTTAAISSTEEEIFNDSTIECTPKGFRFRSTTKQQDLTHESLPNPSRRNGGNELLQWGQRKRSRAFRTVSAITAATDDSSSSSGQNMISPNKIQRLSANPSMPPPFCGGEEGRSSNPRNGFVIGKESSRFVPTRHLDDRSMTRSPSRNMSSGQMVSKSANGGLKRSPPSPDKTETRSAGKDHFTNQRVNGLDHHRRMSRLESTAQIHSEIEKNNGDKTRTQMEVKELPRIYIALSRKEKEEDFYVMKKTKLPSRPRKRAKNIEKGLQFCYPGMWLSDLSKTRYEVREKKSVKKQKRRGGLKGMELESDSE